MPIADIVWAGLVLTGGWASIPIIVLSLAIEWPVYKLVFDVPWLRALYATLIANAASFLCGLVLVPLTTLVAEGLSDLVFHKPTFGLVNEVTTTLAAAMVCTMIEYPVAAWFLKGNFRARKFLAIYAANLVTVGIAAVSVFRGYK